jgi:hypothetical protein
MIIVLIIIILFVSVYLLIDYIGPKEIHLKSDRKFNINCFRAGELIPQEYDKEGRLWASRGMILYSLKEGDDKFIRQAHVPSGFSLYWLYNFTLFRKLVNKPECMEATITGEGHICALSAGFMWHQSDRAGDFHKTMKLRHYGLGTGRGILSNGLLSVNEKQVYFGEYFRNSERSNVYIYKSQDNGRTWNIAYEFETGAIRHIHALQEDPYTGKLWVCSGDADSESLIAWSDNGFKSINIIGKGSQTWRTANLVFTEEAIYWGADTGSIELAGIYRWDKTSGETKSLYQSDGAILYGTHLGSGSMVFSTDREGFPNEKDYNTRLLIFNNKAVSETVVGTWKVKKRNFRFSFAMIRMPRNQSGNALAISIINHKEFQGGEMLIFTGENFINAMVDISVVSQEKDN